MAYDLKNFMLLLGSKVDYFIKQFNLFFYKTKNIDTCEGKYLVKLGKQYDTDFSPFVADWMLRVHAKTQADIVRGRGTKRVIKQFIKRYAYWDCDVLDSNLGGGYGVDPYGEYAYGSVGASTIEIVFWFPAIDETDRDEKLALLKEKMVKYVPAWLDPIYCFYDGTSPTPQIICEDGLYDYDNSD